MVGFSLLLSSNNPPERNDPAVLSAGDQINSLIFNPIKAPLLLIGEGASALEIAKNT